MGAIVGCLAVALIMCSVLLAAFDQNTQLNLYKKPLLFCTILGVFCLVAMLALGGA